MSKINNLVSTVMKHLKSHKFIVHKHDAIRAGLHYDLRLEKDKVLKCWAIRNLPELLNHKKSKVLAIQTEDHNIKWFDFEGPITSEYGRGTMLVFDKGVYQIIEWSPKKIVINFQGVKLQGKYSLILFKPKQWLLM